MSKEIPLGCPSLLLTGLGTIGPLKAHSKLMRRFFKNYAERHLHPGNRFFHLLGLPITFVLPIHFLVWHDKYPASWALIAFVAGYILQFIGHAIEGNDAGELILVKRLLKRPYTEFGPRHPSRSGDRSQAG